MRSHRFVIPVLLLGLVGSGFTLDRVLTCDDGCTRKALFNLPDGSPIETVLMLYEDRATACVSSQSG